MRWILSLLYICVLAAAGRADDKDGKYWVFIGTYTVGKSGSKGIYRFELDLATGKLTNRQLAADVDQPSFLAVHPHVSVDIEERLSDEIVGLIAEGVADLGIVAATVDASALETYPFRKDRFVLVVARDHPLARRSKIAFSQVVQYDFVDRKSTRLNSSHLKLSRMPSSA